MCGTHPSSLIRISLIGMKGLVKFTKKSVIVLSEVRPGHSSNTVRRCECGFWLIDEVSEQWNMQTGIQTRLVKSTVMFLEKSPGVFENFVSSEPFLFWFHGASAPNRPASPLSRLHDHIQTLHSVGLLWTSNQLVACQHTTLTEDKHPNPGGIRTRNPNKRAVADPRLRPCGH